MHEPEDVELLRDFAERQAESAFATLVRRHINLVYSVALRTSGQPQAAEEITQAVFIILARKARGLLRHTALSGWLYQTARLTAANYLRTEWRRARREQEAYMQSLVENSAPQSDDAWKQIAPLLESAMGELGQADRNAVVLRFFDNKSLREVGAALGSSEDAAKMRLSRAVEKLRRYFTKRGVKLTAAAIVAALSSQAVETAPATLSPVVQAAAIHPATIGTSVAALVSNTLPFLAATKIKVLAGVTIAAVLVGGVTGTILLLHQEGEPSPPRVTQMATPGTTETQAEAPEPRRDPLTSNMLASLTTPVGAIALQPDGKILVAATVGGFVFDQQSRTMGWYTRGAIRLEQDGSLDRTFYCNVGRPEASSAMGSTVAVLPDNRIFLSGIFSTTDDKPRHGHAILLPDGRVDDSFDPWRRERAISSRLDFPRLTYSSAVLPDGSIAVMSRPIDTNETRSSWSAYRLDTQGNVTGPAPADVGRPEKLILAYSDIPFGPFPEVPLELVRYAARLPGGGAILAVRDKPIDSEMRIGSLKRFDKEWNLDPAFTCQFTIKAQSEISLHLQRDGKLLVAGLIGQLNGEDFPGLVRLDTNGVIDRTFHCETANALEGRIMDLQIQDDGRIVICGFFTQVNGVTRPHIARLNPDGSLDETFRTPFLTLPEFNRKRLALYRPARNDTNAVPLATQRGLPGALLPENTVTIRSLHFENDAAVVQFSGKPLQTHVLHAAESMSATNWVSIGTNTAGSNGSGVLRDPRAKAYATRFYRVSAQ